jgi:hypothetical protein
MRKKDNSKTISARRLGPLVLFTLLAACHQPLPAAGGAAPPPLPLSSLRERSQSNADALLAFVAADPGWRAWLSALSATATAQSALAGQSMQDVQAAALSREISYARDSYRAATSFYLRPIMMKSSCLDLPEETNGAVTLPDGLLLRYRTLSTAWQRFPDGSGCREATGYVNEIDSPGGIPIATAAAPGRIDWSGNFALALGWNPPFRQIAQDENLGLPALMALANR